MPKDHLSNYFAEIRKYKVLSREEERTLLAKVRAMFLYPDDRLLRCMGRYARDKLVTHNLKLVVSIANKLKKQCGSLTFFDLIFYGNEGLVRAVDEKVDLSRGRFSTGAYYFIWQSIMQAVYWESRDIRVPAHAWRTKTQLSKARARLQTELHREPTLPEILEDCEISEARYRANQDAFHTFCPLTPNVLDTTEDIEEPAPEIPENLKRIREKFAALRDSNRRAYRVIELLFGMHGVVLSIEEISEKLNISEKEVRVLRRKGLASIRRDIKSEVNSADPPCLTTAA